MIAGLAILAALAHAATGSPAPVADAAATAPASQGDAWPGARPAFLDPLLNGVGGREPILVILDGEGDAWVSIEDLQQLGVTPFETARRRREGGLERVSLRSLAPDLSFEVDEDALALRMTASAALLHRSALDLRPLVRPPSLEVGATPSAFLSYAAHATTERDLTGSLEGGVSWSHHLATSTASRLADGSVVRGLTSLTREDPARLLRFTLGDTVVAPRPLGGAPILAGVAVARDPAIDPYRLVTPLPRASAFAATPSTVEVWVNGNLQRTLPVAPGTYDLSNLPITSGMNDVRVLVRDAYGRTEVIDASRYQAQGLLAAGFHDFGWSLGAERRNFGVSSADYGGPVLMGYHRLGLTDALTAGARLELTRELASGGLSSVVGLPVGELQLDGALSGTAGRLGGATLAAWRYATLRGSGGLDLGWTSPEYAVVGAVRSGPRPTWRAGGNGAISLTHAITGLLAAATERLTDGSTRNSVDLSLHARLRPQVYLQAGAGVSGFPAGGPQWTGLVSLIVSPDARTSVETSSTAASGRVGMAASVQRSLPLDEGYGYRLRGESWPGHGTVSGAVQGQTSFGRYEATYDRLDDAEVGAVTASGGVVLLDRKLFLTRPVEQQSYALVRVPELPGVRAFLNNQPVGKTDGDGDVFVPGLVPYYGNRLSISDADVPIDYRVGSAERTVAPPRRGAALVVFDVARLRAVRGRLQAFASGAPVVPAYGSVVLQLEQGARSSPVGDDGAFWLDEVPAGLHRARLLWQGKRCTFAVHVPERGPAVLDLGEVTCVLTEAPRLAEP